MDVIKAERLGIIGGMGPQATQMLYQWILDRTEADCDQEHIPMVILNDTLMPDRTKAILSGETTQIYAKLLADAETLKNCGCKCMAIPCNTSHYFADRLENESGLPLLNMPRLTVERLRERGCKKVAVIATTGTVKTAIYSAEIEKAGMEAWAPSDDIQEVVMSLIYDEIKKGEKGSRHTFAKIDKAVHAAGCDAAILGCTELSVYREYHGLPDFYIDAMEVLAENCVTAMGKTLRRV